ncbi:hypothetical protein LTR36_000914 [Oleoguttula mirabilis]|uniref:Uncharacterized protein n=1 Tax=Oleoguttula mirabilis TaxID=1507867 RepID=A0AAV9JPZ9_9PEZI|nr:hypothetical protein LTR36_000914 [Oleoguttula mirabilis]
MDGGNLLADDNIHSQTTRHTKQLALEHQAILRHENQAGLDHQQKMIPQRQSENEHKLKPDRQLLLEQESAYERQSRRKMQETDREDERAKLRNRLRLSEVDGQQSLLTSQRNLMESHRGLLDAQSYPEIA